MGSKQLKDCPMCSRDGWLDSDGSPLRPVRKRHNCEFCGSTGKMLVLNQDILEEDEDGRDLGCVARREG